ncbi:protein phosphatase 2C domain-containing protein [Actinomycetospora aeridis]|uniref:Protein phosphatase 2C domain-containing protein n=1 Tax=Actinomycetospora aeridis TaxID=3129231 RepID=A0ABU8N6E0_9PSEU
MGEAAEPRRIHGVMVSSTARDLALHRAAVIDTISRHRGLRAVAMEQDAARPGGTALTSSLAKVRETAAYVLIIGDTYGQIPESPDNPEGRSLTELEYREARRLGRPILVFIMGPDHPLPRSVVERDRTMICLLTEFTEDAKKAAEGSPLQRVFATFNSVAELTLSVTESLAELRILLDSSARSPASESPELSQTPRYESPRTTSTRQHERRPIEPRVSIPTPTDRAVHEDRNAESRTLDFHTLWRNRRKGAQFMRTWQGDFEPFVVGDPGSAAGSVIARRDAEVPDRSDIVLDSAAIHGEDDRPSLVLRAASVRGLSHRFMGKVRQDEYAFRQTADGRYLVIAVADGVSSGPLSHLAASVATRQGCALIEGRLRQYVPSDVPWQNVLQALKADIEDSGRRALERRGVDTLGWGADEFTKELATTLVVAIVDVEAQQHGHGVTLMRVGDASAWIRDRRGSWRDQYEANVGRFVGSSVTTALPCLRAIDSPVSTTVRRGEALVLMTDGVGDPLGDGANDFADFLSDVWSVPPAALAFAAHLDFARRSFDDDRTAVAVWPT